MRYVAAMQLVEAPSTSQVECAALPSIELTQREFDALLEYSMSMPTGVAVGKTWKCNRHSGRHVYQGLDPFGTPMLLNLSRDPCWVVCRYESHSATHCIVRTYKPVIVPDNREARR